MGSGSSKITENNANTHNNTKQMSTEPTPKRNSQARNDSSPSKSKNENITKPPERSTQTSNNKDADPPKVPVKQTESPTPALNTKEVAEKPQSKSTTSPQLDGVDPEALLPQQQTKFDSAIRFANLLIKPDSILRLATPGVQKLELKQSLPHTLSLFSLLHKLPNLQIVDISGNHMGPAGFRTVILSLCHNSTITTLNIADNQSDTDSAESVGKMLSSNKCLTCLNISGNYLGLDFFSRCVGPAMAQNSTLKILTCDSIGSTDLQVLGEQLRHNHSLTSLSISSNELSKPQAFVECITTWLQDPECALTNLQMRSTGLKDDCVQKLADALTSNSTLESLDVSANKVSNTSSLMTLITNCIKHKTMTSLIADDIRAATVNSWTSSGEKPSQGSSLTKLSVAGCGLKDEHLSALHDHVGTGALSSLSDLNLANNLDLTNATLEKFAAMTSQMSSESEEAESTVSGPSSLTRLTFGHNNAENLPDLLTTDLFPHLQYLNLRRAKISAAAVEKLAPLCNKKKGSGGSLVTTLVLDCLKLANTGAFACLIGSNCQLMALSLASCQLNDADLTPLCSAIKNGAPVHMLKLSDNRLTDDFVTALCDGLANRNSQPLALIDLSNNKVTSKGAKRFADHLNSNKKPQLHSLNLSFNAIDATGLIPLVGCVGKTCLQSLNASKQEASYLEEDCDNMNKQICKSLGVKVVEEGETVKEATSDLPAKLPDFISYKLTSLGGSPGELGRCLHSRAVSTDYADKKLCHLTLQDAQDLAACFKAQDTAVPVWSAEEWSCIVGTKETPTWLQVAKHRDQAIYMSGLPASITTQKLEGVLENEADCNVDEICLLKDPVTRKNNGLAWVLLSDEDSVTRAVQLYQRGEATVFSQPFTISRLRVTVDDGASDEAKARYHSLVMF